MTAQIRRISHTMAGWVAKTLVEHCPDEEVAYDVGMGVMPNAGNPLAFTGYCVIEMVLPTDDPAQVVSSRSVVPPFATRDFVEAETRGLVDTLRALRSGERTESPAGASADLWDVSAPVQDA